MKMTCVYLAGLLIVGVAEDPDSQGVEFRQEFRSGEILETTIELKAQGVYLTGDPQKKESGEAPRMTVQTRFDFVERVLSVDSTQWPVRVARRVREASSNIDGQEPLQPLRTTIHPEITLLLVERGDRQAVTSSPQGPLSRVEFELVQGLADPLDLTGLLPVEKVQPGDSWKVDDRAARSLSGYDALANNSLMATLETLDEKTAQIRLNGKIGGAVLGGTGTITCEGTLHWDRSAGRIVAIEVQRQEIREPGPVEAGLEFQSTLRLTRGPANEVPAELADEPLADFPEQLPDDWRLLTHTSSDGRFSLLHDRDWHVFTEDDRQTVLRRIAQGEIIAQCNLMAAPKVAPGRHQDVNQFRNDLRQALGTRFGQFLSAGEVPGAPAGGFRYRVAAAGRQGDVPILWYYYLIAGPDGDQLVAAFTLRESRSDLFGDQDLRMMSSIEWVNLVTAP